VNPTETIKPSGSFGEVCRTIADRWNSLSGEERSKYNELAATDLASYKIGMAEYRELQYQNSLLNRGPAREELPVLSYQSDEQSDPSQQTPPTPQLVPASQQHYSSQEVTSLRNIQLALLLQAQVSQSSQPRGVYHQQGQSQQIVLSTFLPERLEREALLNLFARPITHDMPRLPVFPPPPQQQQQQQQDESALARFLRRPGEVQQDMTIMQQQQQPSQQLDASSLLPLLLQQNRRLQQQQHQQQVQHQGTNMFEGSGLLQQQLNALTMQQQQQRFGVLGDATRNSTVFPYLTPQDYIHRHPTQQRADNDQVLAAVTGRQAVLLYSSSDKYRLTDYQILVRQQIELFEAVQEDVDTPTQGRIRHVVLGQVGIRCRHCALLPPKDRKSGAIYYPSRLDVVYQASCAGACCCCCYFLVLLFVLVA
jgi:hypothetical protein